MTWIHGDIYQIQSQVPAGDELKVWCKPQYEIVADMFFIKDLLT